MELHERLSSSQPAGAATQDRDAFADVKNRIHHAVIGDLGTHLFNADMDPAALRARVM